MTTTTCTATNCDRPTQTYLCTDCVRDLQAWIDKVPDLFRDLYDTMARTDNVRPANVGANKGGKEIVGSPAPLNLDAYQLRANLSTVTKTAHEYAQDPHAGGMLELLIDWCQKAELLILGRPERRIIGNCGCGGKVITDKPKILPTGKDPQPVDSGQCQACGEIVGFTQAEVEARINGKVAEEEPEPMTSAEVRAWIKEKAGIIISADDIKNWCKAKKIRQEPAPTKKEKPKYWASDLLRVHIANVDANRRMPKHAKQKGVVK